MFFPSFSGKDASSNISNSPKVPPHNNVITESSMTPITGQFDPSALERGAKALKEIDNSKNSAKAFEVTKLQEITKQQELLRDIEQAQNQKQHIQTERIRVENEEKRKTLNHQHEQERITAQYKAQLEAEAYAKKLQDQQKQNDEWLNQQHKQFLRQEEIRKRNEKDLLEMKKNQLREEKLMEQELLRARIQEEAKGKILQERENADIRIKELKIKAAEERQTKLETLNTTFQSIGNACNTILDDQQKRNALIMGISFAALGIYGARTSTQIARKYIEARLGKPPLVRETSRKIWLKNLIPSLSFWRKTTNFQEKIVLPAELSERLEWVTNSLLAAKKNGTPFRHLLLYGQPGTGKTLFARTLARESNLDYAIMSGGDVGPLGKDAVNEINKLFNWARQSKKGLILFVDEAEAFLRQGRGSATGSMSEDMRNCLSAFLHHTGTESDKFCVVLATNIKDILDKAVLDRIDEEFEFPLPGESERFRMIQMFFDEYIFRPTQRGKRINVDSQINTDYFKFLARKTNGFSGRQLAKLVIGMQSAAFGSGTNLITKSLADTVLAWKIAHLPENPE